MLLSRRSLLLGGSVVGILGIAGLSGCRTAEPPHIKLEKFEGRTVKVACVGDSITFGAGVEDREKNCYPAKLGEYLGSTYEVRNFGRSGATLQKAGDVPYWTTEEFTAATAFQPDVVLIKLGTNDTKPQNWHGVPEFTKDLRALLDHFKGLKSHPQVWVCTPVPVFHDNWGINDATLNSGVIPSIMDECGRRKVPVIDLNDALTGKKAMFPDGVHPNAIGAELMARTVVDAISLRGPNRGIRGGIVYPGENQP